jgi:hypothetical protein
MARSKKRKWKRGNFGYYLVIIAACVFVAAFVQVAVEVVTGLMEEPRRIPDLGDDTLENLRRDYREGPGPGQSAEGGTGGAARDARLEALRERYGDTLEDSEIEELKKTYGDTLTPQEIEKIRESYSRAKKAGP